MPAICRDVLGALNRLSRMVRAGLASRSHDLSSGLELLHATCQLLVERHGMQTSGTVRANGVMFNLAGF